MSRHDRHDTGMHTTDAWQANANACSVEELQKVVAAPGSHCIADALAIAAEEARAGVCVRMIYPMRRILWEGRKGFFYEYTRVTAV